MSWKQMSLQAVKERETERRSALQRKQVETRGQREADTPCRWLFAGEFKDLGSLLTVSLPALSLLMYKIMNEV